MSSPYPLASVFGILVVALTIAAGLIWLERRLLALWQDRYGPNRVGPFGTLQVVADMIKIFTKEDWIPPFADKPVFVLAPAIIMVTVLLSFAVMPFAPGIVVADLDIGLLFFLGMSSLGVYSVVLAGWASDNKYSLLGAHARFGPDAELRSLHGLVAHGRGDAGRIVQSDARSSRRSEGSGSVVPQFLGFVLFMIAGVAETRRLPFDLPEAESELVAGFHTEYSGMKFGMFFVGEYLGITLISVHDHGAVFRRLARARAARASSGFSSRCSSSSAFSSCCGPRCRGRATTSLCLGLESDAAADAGKPAGDRRGGAGLRLKEESRC